MHVSALFINIYPVLAGTKYSRMYLWMNIFYV